MSKMVWQKTFDSHVFGIVGPAVDDMWSGKEWKYAVHPHGDGRWGIRRMGVVKTPPVLFDTVEEAMAMCALLWGGEE